MYLPEEISTYEEAAQAGNGEDFKIMFIVRDSQRLFNYFTAFTIGFTLALSISSIFIKR